MYPNVEKGRAMTSESWQRLRIVFAGPSIGAADRRRWDLREGEARCRDDARRDLGRVDEVVRWWVDVFVLQLNKRKGRRRTTRRPPNELPRCRRGLRFQKLRRVDRIGHSRQAKPSNDGFPVRFWLVRKKGKAQINVQKRRRSLFAFITTVLLPA
jgi:hypothetical protein